MTKPDYFFRFPRANHQDAHLGVRTVYHLNTLQNALNLIKLMRINNIPIATFDVVQVQSISFTGPAADTLMGLINQPKLPLSFDIGLVPGVFMGALSAALVTREFKWQQFTSESGTARFLIGASMMGFGSMLAGGCAVGAGISGGSVLVVTAWIALFCMWIGAGVTDFLFDRKADEAKAAAEAARRKSELSAESGPQLIKSSDLVQPN